MINSSLQTRLDAAIRNAIRSVLESDAPDTDVGAMRDAIKEVKRQAEHLCDYVTREAAAVSSAVYELENLDTSDIDYAVEELSKLLPDSNASTQ